MCFIVKGSILWTTASFLTVVLYMASLLCIIQWWSLLFWDCDPTLYDKKIQDFIHIWPQREKGKSCPCPRPVCDHNIRIATPKLWSQDMACFAAKVVFDWWRQEVCIIGGGGAKQESRKKKPSASKTSILSFRKLDYIHHITGKKHTRRWSLHESKLINASGYKEKIRSIINLKCCRESSFFIF